MSDLVIRDVRFDGVDVAGDIVIRDRRIVSIGDAAPADWDGLVVEGHGHLALPGSWTAMLISTRRHGGCRAAAQRDDGPGWVGRERAVGS